MGILSKIGSKALNVVAIGCTFHCFFEYVADFVICSGESMKPTLKNNDILICNKLSQRRNSFKRDDIIIAAHPNHCDQLICKRLVGVPGDIVILGNGEKSPSDGNDTDHDDTEESHRGKTIVIPRGYCWIEGDNSLNSTDSRNYGKVPLGLIKSKVIARLWPLSEFKVF